VSQHPTTTESRTRILAGLHEDVIDLDEEGQRILALVKFAREAVTKQMTDGMGYTQVGVSKENLNALKELVTIFDKATESMARLDRTADLRSKKLTKDEYLAIAKKLVLSLGASERTGWLRTALDKHRALVASEPPSPYSERHASLHGDAPPPEGYSAL
jgi:hypothetical protein